MSLLEFLLATYGVTNIVTGGRILAPLRDWLDRRSTVVGYWVRCPVCLGVPVGMTWALVGVWPATGRGRLVDVLAAGAVSSGWCWGVRVLLHRLGEDEL